MAWHQLACRSLSSFVLKIFTKHSFSLLILLKTIKRNFFFVILNWTSSLLHINAVLLVVLRTLQYTFLIFRRKIKHYIIHFCVRWKIILDISKTNIYLYSIYSNM